MRTLKTYLVGFAVTALLIMMIGCAVQRPLTGPAATSQMVPNQNAVDHFVDGIIYDMEQNIPAALLSYHEALIYDSTASEIYLALGKDYLALGKKPSAMRMLQKAVKMDPASIASRELLARIYGSEDRWNEAELLFRQILSVDSTNVEAFYNLAVIYLQQKDRPKAAKMYEKILTYQKPPNPQVLIGLGELYIDLQRPADAADIYNELIEINPEEEFGYYGLGIAQEEIGDTAHAIINYKKTLLLEPDFTQARDRLSRIYLQQNNRDQALELYQNAVDRDSTDLAGWLQIAEINRLKGDTLQAIQVLEQSKLLFPEEWRIRLDLGRIYLDQQEFTQAHTEFEAVTRLHAESFWGWLFLGISQAHQDSLEQAIPNLQKSIELMQNNALGHYYLGSVLNQLNRHSEAIPCLDEAIHLRPNWVNALSLLAGSHESLKHYEVADSLFQKALKLEPDNPLLLNNYGYSLSQRDERLDDAMAMASKALSIEPENGAYLDTVGWIYFKLGEPQKALHYIEKAAKTNINFEVFDHLGDVYMKLGFPDKAKEAWQQALAKDKDNQEILKKMKQLQSE